MSRYSTDYEVQIRDCLTLERLKDIREYMDAEIQKLEALRPAIMERADHISRFIVHKYRVELFYHNSKRPWYYKPAFKDPNTGEIKRDYSQGERKGAHYSVRVDHRVYDGPKLIVNEYEEYKSLAFSPREKGIAYEYIRGLADQFKLKLLEREDLIKADPEIRSEALILGSVWDRDLPGSVWDGRI